MEITGLLCTVVDAGNEGFYMSIKRFVVVVVVVVAILILWVRWRVLKLSTKLPQRKIYCKTKTSAKILRILVMQSTFCIRNSKTAQSKMPCHKV